MPSLFRNAILASALFQCALAGIALAASPYEIELQQLTDQRDRAVALETQRVDRIYKDGLEKLLLRATQNRDYDAVAKISDELRKLTATSVALPERIQNLLTSTSWLHNGKYHYRFSKNGTFAVKEPGVPKGKYQIDGQTGVVTFMFEGVKASGEGVKFDPEKGTFIHLNGQSFVPAP